MSGKSFHIAQSRLAYFVVVVVLDVDIIVLKFLVLAYLI